jgi:aspartyl-tRNA(Asn)/glutamyl-tRNA(Gln) amidotransferase subunit B
VRSGKLTGRAAKELLPAIEPGESPEAAAARLNLLALDDAGLVTEAARAAIANNPAVVEDYRKGKTAAIGRLMGETMRATGGRAKPDQVREALLAMLQEPLENN